uniref:Large ribosomal subunit protein bL19m n=1 Tax=Trichuris muris TaxID=70415 RepID=A0A5S6QE45_TRIMR
MFLHGRQRGASICQLVVGKSFFGTWVKKDVVPLPVAFANRPSNGDELIAEYRFACPEFLPSMPFARRNHLLEKLQRMDMLRRRERIKIPEFYVGSILAVTMSVPYTANRLHRFVGICIQRDWRGLKHFFTVRNVIHNEGFEIRYDLYNPTLISIEVLKLEKRLDDELLYLRDALPKYSTFPFDMEPQPHKPVKASKVVSADDSSEPMCFDGEILFYVELKPPPWTKRWHLRDCKGIQNFWELVPLYKKLMYRKAKLKPWDKYDIISTYKGNATLEDMRYVLRQIDQKCNCSQSQQLAETS